MITYKTVKVTVTVLAYIDGEGGDDHEGDFPGSREADDEPYG